MNIHQLTGAISATLLATTLMAQEGVKATTRSPSPIAQQTQNPATSLTWLTDFQAAKAQANAQRKSILLYFHGANWCPPCVQMQRQVIDSSEFAEFARRSLVLVDVDFPENPTQSEQLGKANLALKRKFNLIPEWGEGLPTIVLLNEAGETVFQETGYAGGGPAEVLSKLRRHVAAATSVSNSTGYKNLSIDEFAQMAADKANVVLDVRTAREFESGHVPGALNLDVSASGFEKKVAELDKGKTYLVHCASGVRSVKACEILGHLGFPKLYNLPVGFRGWAKAGKPVQK